MASNEQDYPKQNEAAPGSGVEANCLLLDETAHPNGTIQSSEPPILEHQDSLSIPADMVAEMIVDFWKISKRAKSEKASERVLAACERAEERVRRIGFEVEEMTGKPYDTNMRVRVVQHDGGEDPSTISECLSPAVYYKKHLIREAEVITKGV